MVKILEIFSFGFVFEIQNENPFFQDSETDIFLNGKKVLSSNKNVNVVFNLKPNTFYDVKLCKDKTVLESFSLMTEDCEYLINIKDYNARGDGISDDTSAINLAIYTAPTDAVIYFPKGVYLVDQILLKSNLDFYFDEGACVKQNTDRSKMSILKGLEKDYRHEKSYINTTWEGNPLDSYCPLVYGKNISNVRIYGHGILDGNGAESGFWVNPKARGIIYRPNNLELVESRKVSICGLSSVNSSSWNMHTLFSEDINFYAIHLESPTDSPNTDGINPESSSRINIIGCTFNVGDDCIAVKSGKYYISQSFYKMSRDISVRNCFMNSGHGGVVIGSEISCGVEKISVSNCFFNNTDRGIRIKTRRGRGEKSIVSEISAYNCKMQGVKHCLTINMFYNCDPDGKSDYVRDKSILKKDKLTPTVREISLERITAENISGCAVFVYGLPENPVENLFLKDCRFSFASEIVNTEIEMLEDFEASEKLGIFIENCDGEIIHTDFNGDFTSFINMKNQEVI